MENKGFWDILEGLRWVNKNIGFFGGDTSRITIAGESAGSIAVGLLSVSPLAKGLYKRQIMESGSPVYLLAENNTQNLAFSQRVAEMVGCASPTYTIEDNPAPVLECLKSLWDVLEGLRWVNKYIGCFGGDTSRITIAGESAGSWLVGLLAVSPLAKGLYKRAIMQSGSPVFLEAENNTQNVAFSQSVAEMVGCANSTFTIKDYPGPVVECLRKVHPAILARAEYSLDPVVLHKFNYQYGDEILPENPRISVLKGDFRCTELLIGSNQDEGSLLITAQFPEMFGFFGQKNPLFSKSAASDLIRKAFKNFPDPESVVQHYLPDALPEHASTAIRYQTYTSFGDMLLLCPTVYHAEKCSEKGGKVYSYLFTHRKSNSPFAPWMGKVHFDEIQFVFGSPLLDTFNYTQEDQEISEQIIEVWSSFAKDGKPSIPWPLYSKEVPLIKLLGPRIVTGENGIGPHRDNCDFFRPFYTSL
ncbi:unnamed protein product [Larinioides sclopetarius]|uniref:Carboxylic ester hydrolase n=1 Tax=Larinioides sclopetarius TaxID=280406 RepID=A0AAV1YV46_9ARAC